MNVKNFTFLAILLTLSTCMAFKFVLKHRVMSSKDSTTQLFSSSGLKGAKGFVRSNPMSDKISANAFHHVEFYCGDATNTYKRFLLSLGMELVAKSDQSTGNTAFASYTLQSGDMRMTFTAPYSIAAAKNATNYVAAKSSSAALPVPSFDHKESTDFFTKHGFGVRAVAIEVADVESSYNAMVANGGQGHLAPTRIADDSGRGWADFAEVFVYGDVVLRLINTVNFTGKFLPNFADVPTSETKPYGYGMYRFDHIVGNLWSLQPTMDSVMKMTGFHEFAEFIADDVGTVESGLNSVVLANNNEMILMPINEPTFGTKRKSQIQTYLEQNEGAGVQHIALFSSDIFSTIRKMREATKWGGFEFQDPPPPTYYDNLSSRIGDSLTAEEYRLVRELGLLVDKDDQGVLLQVFTRPVGDRPTFFFEIIQRVGCIVEGEQKPGCGGFGKGNFRDLFKSIEEYEKKLAV